LTRPTAIAPDSQESGAQPAPARVSKVCLKARLSSAIKDAGLEKEMGMSVMRLLSLSSAIHLIDGGLETSEGRFTATEERTIEMFREWAPEMVRLVGMMRWHRFTERLRQLHPVSALMLYTLRHQPDVAPEFWRRAVESDNIPNGGPQMNMMLFINAYGLDRMSEGVYVRRVAEFWNAYFEGRPLGHPRKDGQPIRVAGTPLHGERTKAEYQSQRRAALVAANEALASGVKPKPAKKIRKDAPCITPYRLRGHSQKRRKADG
jgi:hypothetical protein